MALFKKTGGSKKGSPKGNARKGGAASLIEADRDLLDERLGEARSSGAAGNESLSGLFEALERFGLSSDRVQSLRGMIDDMEVRESVEKAQEYLGEQIENARDYAKENPGKVIGGAAGVLVGASLLAMALRRAGGEEKRGGSRAAGSKPRSASRARSTKSSGGSKSTGSPKSSASSKSGSKSSASKSNGARSAAASRSSKSRR